MKKKSFEFKSFIFILLAVWVLSDVILTSLDPFKHSLYLAKNDFEVTELEHPEKVWDKVFFGSSVVVASFIEEESKSGYINSGVVYGTVSDIYNMMKKREINIGSDLVIAVNDIAFLDTLDTNPTYIWHKKWYQHYLFFQRDKLHPVFEKGVENLANAKPIFDGIKVKDAKKTLSFGRLSDEELEENRIKMLERFGHLTLDDCKGNFEDLEKLIKLCEKKDIRLRAIWMPWNPKIEKYKFVYDVMQEANRIFEENSIEVYDMTDMFSPENFYDIGHMNYEVGAPRFTKLVDEFLCK